MMPGPSGFPGGGPAAGAGSCLPGKRPRRGISVESCLTGYGKTRRITMNLHLWCGAERCKIKNDF